MKFFEHSLGMTSSLLYVRTVDFTHLAILHSRFENTLNNTAFWLAGKYALTG
jgi:hypothetical protein